MKYAIVGTVLGTLLVLGCGKKEAPVPTASVSASASTAPSVAPSTAPLAPAAPSASVSPVPDAGNQFSETPPASFTGGEKVTHPVLTGLGCEGTSMSGWLKVLCRKKNGAGGHPKRGVIAQPTEDAGTGGAGENPDILPDDQGELTIVVPFRKGAGAHGFLEWTDTKYTFASTDGVLKMDWAVGLEVRRSCAKLEREQSEVVRAAQKGPSPEPLTAAEASKLPRFGTCQSAGLGSYALFLREISASGIESARVLHVGMDVVWVTPEGKVNREPLGTIDTKAGGLEIRPLSIYDYNDDGQVELIIPHDVKSTVEGKEPSPLSAIWTVQDERPTPYKAFAPTLGGAQTTQLSFDMRPDIGIYSPFIAYLGPDCGLAKCPSRLTGPVRYAHSLLDGTFSLKDADAQGAIARSCPKGGSLIVPGNVTRTAQNLGCARLRGEDAAALEKQLLEKTTEFCKETPTCPLIEVLVRFTRIPVAD